MQTAHARLGDPVDMSNQTLKMAGKMTMGFAALAAYCVFCIKFPVVLDEIFAMRKKNRKPDNP